MIFDYLSLGKRIKQYRLRRGLSQMALADLLDCDTSYISYVETGKKCLSLQMFVTLANILQVSADELLIDCLDKNLKATNSDIAELLSDCSEYERRVLTGTVRSLKAVLRENSSLFSMVRSRQMH